MAVNSGTFGRVGINHLGGIGEKVILCIPGARNREGWRSIVSSLLQLLEKLAIPQKGLVRGVGALISMAVRVGEPTFAEVVRGRCQKIATKVSEEDCRLGMRMMVISMEADKSISDNSGLFTKMRFF